MKRSLFLGLGVVALFAKAQAEPQGCMNLHPYSVFESCEKLSQVCFKGPLAAEAMLPDQLVLRSVDSSKNEEFNLSFCGTSAPSDVDYCLYRSPENSVELQVEVESSAGVFTPAGFLHYRAAGASETCLYKIE
ncbi:MAG: hypothetical protein JST16_11430 [Bdellovibrionales bacterium]|nr:hypothetical protein [Bdellovibrionales bacterium]